MQSTPTRYASDAQLELLYGIKTRTWQQWRFRGQGPRYTKAGRLVRYSLDDVESWLQQSKKGVAQ